MKDLPIIFSAPMVQALLAGRKTMTRRLAWRPWTEEENDRFYAVAGPEITRDPRGNPSSWQKVKPGDRLWIRENWRAEECVDDVKPRELSRGEPIHYEASNIWRSYGSAMIQPGKLRPSIHMPRWASRLTLVVTATKIERLQEISLADIRAEGWVERPDVSDDPEVHRDAARDWWSDLWTDLNGIESWRANPEVIALSFTVHQENIDLFVGASARPQAAE